jgi:hypothetical protein
MKRAILGVAVAMLLPPQSFALTALCVESGSTGFNWRDGNWVNSDYNLDQYIVQDVSNDPELVSLCIPTEKVVNQWGTAYADRCFNLSVVGEEKSSYDTTQCRVIYDEGGDTTVVMCDQSRYSNFKFEPTGEFVLTRTYGVPDSDRAPSDQRDSLVLSVGKCSVIAP